MRGYLVYVLTVKYLILFKIQSQYIRLDGLVVDFVVVVVASGEGGFLKTFLEGSVDHIIYRDYTVNRRFFIYCSLACTCSFDYQCFACIAADVPKLDHGLTRAQ